MNNILVINVNWLGDVIFSRPVFRALRERYPQARISCMAVPRVKEILTAIKEIDEIIVYDEEGRHRFPWMKLVFIFELAQKKFDAAFLLHGSLTRALLVFLAGIPQRIGYDTKQRGIFLTQRIPHTKDQLHRSDYYLRVVESAGVHIRNRICDLEIQKENEKKVKELLQSQKFQSNRFTVALNLGGNWDLKRWPRKSFHQLLKELLNDPQIQVIIPGSESDQALVEEVTQGLIRKPINLAGKTTLSELMALFKYVNVFVSADSGPLHLASGVGTPVIGLFGPTRPEITGPRGSGKVFIEQQDVGCNRKPCYYLQCPDNICMQSINVSNVFKIIRQIQSS
jgi:lipopolysaccharide heptosyltransferase II